MTEKQENIVAWLLGVSLALHIFGYFFWSYVKIVNIYYVSIYFLFMNLGLALMMATRGALMRYVSVAMFSFGGGFLYMEFAGNPQDWTNVNIATFIFIGINSLLISHFVEKYKNKHNG